MHVIKIGGSLTFNSKNLLSKLIELNKKIVLVPGGGNFADSVRELYDRTDLGELGAHKIATICTDITGIYFSEISGIKTANNLFDAKKILENENIVIILPSKIILSTDELPCSWSVTSDSFAAYIAKLLKSKVLIIATDVDGIYDKYPEGKLLNTINTKTIKGFTSVDKHLPKLISEYGIECFVVNGNHPERIKNILNDVSDTYTKITLE
ncbi:aspartate/glutamate/uridylate kinase [Methanococcus vannielii SB]|jgi:aspartokinase-like uncharacterized kinase|uniref:Aspartate/glutamate/uridylate kinase n=1 Tax=Methanococcus vannielii (strain ATCC 35089 / DSM 1224 / JCM 13029 / OCM 148 / SB) TaxID=406327 RepID=A6UQ44_METVS|nr:[5-(aminomethyl)furan-3-yl]methyl phosphate kinase [Methanococcus vannielii]ABR54616.1 aspartate/glutamate/uridylate kinase [Methanococcus vannielii SB]